MKHTNHPPQEHAYSRYMCVTEGLVDELQQDYFAGRELGRSLPHVDETMATIIVAESLEADYVWNNFLQVLLGHLPGPQSQKTGDWSKATSAEFFFHVADVAREMEDERQAHDYWALAWALLEEVCKSPTASPMLWYEDIFFDVGQELRVRGEPEAVKFFKQALAHDLHHNDGDDADICLRELAETYLWVDDLDAGLQILTGMLRNDPTDVWTYNAMAITFGRFGLTEVGAEAARRGLALVEATGDPENLHDQLLAALERLQKSERRGREAEVDRGVLADLRAALASDFDAGEHRPVAEICRELVPGLDRVVVKRPPERPDLPPPEEFAQRQSPPPVRRDSEATPPA